MDQQHRALEIFGRRIRPQYLANQGDTLSSGRLPCKDENAIGREDQSSRVAECMHWVWICDGMPAVAHHTRIHPVLVHVAVESDTSVWTWSVWAFRRKLASRRY